MEEFTNFNGVQRLDQHGSFHHDLRRMKRVVSLLNLNSFGTTFGIFSTGKCKNHYIIEFATEEKKKQFDSRERKKKVERNERRKE